MANVMLTSEAASRIIAATRIIENQRGSNHPGASPQPPRDGLPPEVCFYVDLTQTGGSAGSATTTCSFTYTVALDSVNLGTSVAVSGARIPNCEMTAGTLGIACFKAGELVLLWAAEVPVTKTVEVITAWQVDLTSGEVQKKTRSIVVLDAGTESDWTRIEDTEESKAIECTEPGS